MSRSRLPCDDREAYREGTLSPSARADFEAHLEECPACREEAEADRRLDRLLALAAGRLPEPPRQLVDALRARKREMRRRRTVLIGASVLAAAGVAFAALAALHRAAPGVEGSRPTLAEKDPAGTPAPPAPARPAERAHVWSASSPASKLLAVPADTGNPSVTIVMLYPVLASEETSESETTHLEE